MSIRPGVLSSGCHKAAGKPKKVSQHGFGITDKGSGKLEYRLQNAQQNQSIGTISVQPRYLSIGSAMVACLDDEVFAMKKLAIMALALMTSLGSVAPAGAFDVNNPRGKEYDALSGTPAGPNQRYSGRCGPYRNCNGDRNNYRYSDRERYRYDDRRDYRRHSDNTGAIIGGLAAGAIIGGVIASQPRARSGDSHVDYCYNRYRSYRASDNTYQPNSGPRRQCVGS
jgi:hypothetical protein